MLNLCLNLAGSGDYLLKSFQVAYVSVGVIDVALTDVMTFAIATKHESTKDMYEAYYKRAENKRKATDWYTIFEKYTQITNPIPRQLLIK